MGKSNEQLKAELRAKVEQESYRKAVEYAAPLPDYNRNRQLIIEDFQAGARWGHAQGLIELEYAITMLQEILDLASREGEFYSSRIASEALNKISGGRNY